MSSKYFDLIVVTPEAAAAVEQAFARIDRRARRARTLHALLGNFRVFASALVAACLFGCAGGKGVPDARHNAELVVKPVDLATDSSTLLPPVVGPLQSTEKPGLLRRLFPAKSTAASSTPRKCKGCTFNYVQGNQSTATVGKKSTAAIGDDATSTSTTTGKKSGPAVIASDSVDLNSAGPNSQQVVTTGNGNQVDAKKQDTTQEAKGAWATFVDNLTGPLGYVLAGAVVLALLAWRAHRNNPMA